MRRAVMREGVEPAAQPRLMRGSCSEIPAHSRVSKPAGWRGQFTKAPSRLRMILN